jgi:hypothetical protein
MRLDGIVFAAGLFFAFGVSLGCRPLVRPEQPDDTLTLGCNEFVDVEKDATCQGAIVLHRADGSQLSCERESPKTQAGDRASATTTAGGTLSKGQSVWWIRGKCQTNRYALADGRPVSAGGSIDLHAPAGAGCAIVVVGDQPHLSNGRQFAPIVDVNVGGGGGSPGGSRSLLVNVPIGTTSELCLDGNGCSIDRLVTIRCAR